MSRHETHLAREAGIKPRRRTAWRATVIQLTAILGLSWVLGLTFNASSPVGVKFGDPFVASVTSQIVVKPTAETEVQPAPPPAPPLPPAVAAVPAPATPLESSPTMPPSQESPQPSAPVTVSPLNHAAHIQSPPESTEPSARPNPSEIHWPEAKVLFAEGRAVLVDVRPKPIFEAGHIPGAISLPENNLREDFSKFLSEQPAGKIVIVYCSSTSCSQSARVATWLVSDFKWPDVRYMTGGYMEYQQMEHVNPAQ